MTMFKLKENDTVTREYEVEADTLEEAIEAIQTGLYDGTERGVETEMVEYAIEGQMGWNRIPASSDAQIIDTENPAHALDIDANLEVIWRALEAVREELLPEGDANYDEQWNEITSAMAYITESLGAGEESEPETPILDQIIEESAMPVTEPLNDFTNSKYSEYEGYPSSAWMAAVAAGKTRLGYLDWVNAQAFNGGMED